MNKLILYGPLVNALNDLGIENVKEENAPAYFKAVGELEVGADELTTQAVQELVNKVNTESLSQAEKDAIVKAVQDADEAGNQVTLLNALQNDAFTKVNAKWIAAYQTGIVAGDDTIEKIQGKINTANDNAIKQAITDLAMPSVDKAELQKVNALINDYATVDDKGVIKDGTIKAIPDAIELQLAIVSVREATTPTRLKSAVSSLATLVNDTAQLDMKDYVDANAKDYIAKIKADDVKTVANVKSSINDTNATNSKALVDAVKTAADAVSTPATADEKAALLKALNNLGLKQVAESNVDQYAADASDFATASDTTATPAKTKDDVQTQVNKSNVKAISSATDADELLTALKVLELKNVVDANKDAYLADGGATINTDATTIDNALKAINKQVIVDAQVKAINDADSVAEVKGALDALANVDEVVDYLKIRSVDRDFVAAYVLDKKPKGGYVDVAGSPAVTALAAIDSEVSDAQTAHAGALSGINGLTLTSTPDEVVTELDKMLDENFAELSNVQKSLKAQEFQDKLVYDGTGAIKTLFTTLAAVKELLFN